MTKNSTKMLKLLFFISIVMLSSCSAEEDLLSNNENKQAIRIESVKFEELLKRQDFRKAYSKIHHSTDSISSMTTIMETQNGFTISDFPVKIIEYGNNRKSFTLSILADNQKNNEFDNLVLDIDSINNVKATMVKYKPISPVEIITSNNVKFEGNIELTPIVYNTAASNLSSKLADFCISIITSKCNGIPYDCGGHICGFTSTRICSGSGGSGSSSGGPVDSGPGFGGSTSSGTTTVFQDPTAAKLNSIMSSVVVKSKLTDLKSRVTDNLEHGYEFSIGANNKWISSPLLAGGTTGVQFDSVQINTIFRVHVHHNGLEPTPSIEDVIGFASMFHDKVNLGATNAQEVTSMVMSRNINYAMRITDPLKAKEFFSYYKNSNKTNLSGKTYRSVVNKLFASISKQANDACGGICTNAQFEALLEMYFIKALKTLDSGISIFYSLPTTPTRTNYSWLQLN